MPKNSSTSSSSVPQADTSSRWRRCLAIGRHVAACMLFLLVLEVCARVDDRIRWGMPLLSNSTADDLRSVDDAGLPVNVALACFEKWQNNSAGFRGQELANPKQENSERIFCLGTSETYGFAESPAMEWPMQLAGLLNEGSSAIAYEVVNAGCVRLQLPAMQEYLERYVLPHEPDAVVILAHPAAYTVQDLRTSSGKSIRLRSTKREPKTRLRVFPKLKQTAKRLLPSTVTDFMEKRLVRTAVQRAESRWLRDGTKPLDSPSPATLQRYAADLAELVAFLEQRDIAPVLCTFPSLAPSNEPAALFAARRFYTQLSPQGIRTAFSVFAEATRRVAQETATPLVDLEASIPSDRSHFVDLVHFTDRGASVVAELVSQAFGE